MSSICPGLTSDLQSAEEAAGGAAPANLTASSRLWFALQQMIASASPSSVVEKNA